MNAKKTRTSAIAVVAAAAIALSGTFAWQSISQTALNEAKGSNPGGRLHDDFSGYTASDTKDIYVENFANQAIYARIRLDEYMELGTGAGEADGAEGKTATSLVSGAEIGDPTTWTTHIPSADDVAVGTEDGGFHDYWTWTMGGSTVYMPTFDKNQDSLSADINGTLEGTTEGDDIYYDDYYKYAEGETVTGDAYYDADDNTTDEYEEGTSIAPGAGGTEGANFKIVNETHTAAETLSATVITMAAYNELDDPTSFVGWVYDTDGWAYWSQAIQPGTATGLLLDNITLSNTPTAEWYYAINAVAQFITADDLGLKDGTGFYTDVDEAPSDNALALLASIGVKTDVAAVITDENDNVITGQTFSLTAGATKTLSVTNIATTAAGYAAQTWNWESSDTSVVTLSASTGNSVTATVTDTATEGSTATITVTNQDDTDQTATVTIQVVAEGEIGGETGGDAETSNYTVTVTAADNATEITQGSTLTFTASAAKDGTTMETQPSFTWSATAGSISDGTLSVDTSVTADTTVTVTATATIDDKEFSGTATVTVKAAAVAATYSVGETVTLDNIEFVVMATDVNGDSDHILLLSKYILEERAFDAENAGGTGTSSYGDNKWDASPMRTYLNGTGSDGWLNGKTAIQAAAVEYTIYTQTEYNNQTMIETKDKIFLLSQADVAGTYNDGSTTDATVTNTQYYTIGEKLDLTNNSTVSSWVAYHVDDTSTADWWWLRSPRYNSNNPTTKVALVFADGTLSTSGGFFTTGGVRPAFVASIQNLPSE